MSNRQQRAKRVAGQRQFRRLAARLFPKGFALAASVAGLLGANVAHAANDLYWDTNGVATGSGDPTGIWGTDPFWNSDPLGEAAGTFTAATASTNDLHFSAGTTGTAGTVTVNGDVLGNSIRFDNDVALTLSGGNTITLGGGAVGTSGIVVATGTTAANAIGTTLVFTDPTTTIQNNGGGALTLGAVNGTSAIVNSGSGAGGVSVGAIGATVGAITQNSATSHLTLTGANASTGGINITAGTVAVTADNQLGGAGNVITLNGGALQMTGTTGFNVANNRVFKIGANGATFNNNISTGGNFNVMGVISDVAPGAGALFITGTGVTLYVPAAQNTYTGGTHLGAGTTTVINADSIGSATTNNLVSGGLGVGTVFFDGGRMRASTGTGSIIGNALVMTADTTFSTGATKALQFTGPMTLSGGTRTVTQLTAGQDIVFNGAIGDGGNGYGLTVGAGSVGNIVLGGTNTYTGPTTVDTGVLVLSPTGTLVSSPVNVGVAGTGGTLTVRGSKTLGGALTVGGNATAASAGTLNLQDGTVNSVTLTNTTGPALALGGAAAGDASNFNIDLGPGGADSLVLGAGAQATINGGGAKLGINVLAGYTGGSQAIVSSPTTNLTTQAGAVTLDTTTGNFGGFTLGLVTTANAVTLTGTKLVAVTPNTLYFKGAVDGKWNGFAGGNLNNSNWTTDAAGTTDAKSDPGANTDVHFSAAGFTAANQVTTLNQNYSIKSLTMDAAATTVVSVAAGTPAGTLTIGAGGITTQTGSAALTVSAPVTLGATQTWTHGSAATMTVSGAVGGTADLVLTRGNAAGGTLLISGAVNIAGTITRDATNAAAQDQITGVIGAGVTAITQNNPNATSSLVLDGNNTALNATITVNAGRLDGRNTTSTTNTIRAFGTGQIVLNGGTLDARANGTGVYQVITTGDGVTGNNVTLGGNATIDFQRTSGTTAVGSMVVFNNLSASAGKILTVTGTNRYAVGFAGTTTVGPGGATLNPTTAPLTLLGQVSAGANGLTVTGAGTTRLLNTATGAGANDITGTITVNGGSLTGYAQAAGAAPGAGSNSLGTATIALTNSASVLRLAPTFNGGLTTPAAAGVIDKTWTGVTLLSTTNVLAPTQPITTGTAGLNPTGVQTLTQINIPGAATQTQATHQFTGLINITAAGVYNFSHFTDDGGNLFVDGHAPIVTGNSTVANSFYLTAGLHTLTSRWHNNTGNGGDVLSYQGPDTANALVVVPASALFNTTAAAMATNFGNNVTVAAGTSPSIEIASDTTLGSLTMVGTGAGTGLNVTGAGDVNTLTFGGAVTLTDNFTLNNPTAHVLFNGGLLAPGGNNFTVTKNGFGTLTVNGPVQANGGFVVNGGVVNVTGTGTIGTPGAPVNLNGGVIDLNGTSQNLGALSGTGTIQNGTITSSVLIKQGPGTVTLAAAVTSPTVNVRQGAAGITVNPAAPSTLKLDFSHASAPVSDMVSPTSNLVLGGAGPSLAGGGTFAMQGKNSTDNSQTFAGTLVDAGASAIALTAAGTPGNVLLNAGPITRNAGGTVDFSLPGVTQSATNGVVTSTGSNGQILTIGNTAFATVGGNSWAAKSTDSPGNVVDLSVAGPGGATLYTAYAATPPTMTGHADITGSFTAPTTQTFDSLRMNSAIGNTLTLAGTNTISTGGILFGSASAAANTITGGTIVPGTGQELVVISNKPGTTNVISSVIANGASGPTTVTYRANPNGTTTGSIISVANNNTYTGPTYITSGRVQLSTTFTTPFGTGPNAIVHINGNTDGQFYSTQNTTIANPFVIIGNGFNENGTRRGVIRLDSSATANPTLGGQITLLGDASIGNPAAITGAGTGILNGNIVTSNALGSTSFALTKLLTGPIRLRGTNSQTATNINAGLLNVLGDAQLGAVGAPINFIGSSTLQFNNTVAEALPATRNFTIAAGTANFDTIPAAATADVTINGVISGPGAFSKGSAGGGGVSGQTAAKNLILTGVNTFAGNVTVNHGRLIITNSSALGSLTATKSINLTNGTNGLPELHLDAQRVGGTSAPNIDLPANFSFQTSSNAGAITNVSGDNIIRGNFTLTGGGGATGLTSNAGSVTLTGNLTPDTTGRELNLRGNGNGTISGVIANGTTLDLPVFRNNGTGTWTLGGPNTYTGRTDVTAGVVKMGHANALGNSAASTGGNTDNGTNVSATGVLDLNGNAPNELIKLNGTGIGATGALINTGAAVTIGGTVASVRGGTGGLGITPVIALTGGGGTGATATGVLGVTTQTFAVATPGAGYAAVATATIAGGGATTQGAATSLMGVTNATFTVNANSGYTVVPTVTFNTPTGGTAATGHFVNNAGVLSLVIDTPGSGYTAAPTATVSGGTTSGTGVTVTPTFTNLIVTGVTVTANGAGYTSAPTLTFGGTASTTATATANANNFMLSRVTLTNVGAGYTSAPTASLTTAAGTVPLTAATAGVVLTGNSSIGGTGDITLASTVTESGGARSLTKVGSNTVNLNATNTYTGPTSVAGGTLRVNGSVAASSGVAVATGGRFVAGSTQTIKSLNLSAGSGQAEIANVPASLLVLTVGDGSTTAVALQLGAASKLDLRRNAM
ncbi:MAG TPA: autotransporter-associated beta strand repeat-containing protein, partial [Tepidisphaeraceae bacterium]|nr:autotransporter-associated beta strand repeat-containing protein [Tepidisphaeraceae bacterium]